MSEELLAIDLKNLRMGKYLLEVTVRSRENRNIQAGVKREFVLK